MLFLLYSCLFLSSARSVREDDAPVREDDAAVTDKSDVTQPVHMEVEALPLVPLAWHKRMAKVMRAEGLGRGEERGRNRRRFFRKNKVSECN